MVGCVLVRHGRIIGEGYHRRFGGPHAEIEALRSAGGRAGGATAYVTLEPCCHYGKTPPCTNALIAARIARAVFAVRDPFPQVHGRGARLLRRAGIDVVSGVCAAEATELMAPYLKLQRLGRPWVILKWAQSIDGKIATRTGDSKWISQEASRLWVQRLRARVDAIGVGVGTVLADDPSLTCRDVPPRRVATRLVLDPALRIPLDSRLVRTARKTPTLVVGRKGQAPAARASRLQRRGVEVLLVSGTRASLDLPELLETLGSRGMSNVLVEGGGRTVGLVYDAGLADEACIFVSPRLIGGADAPSALSATGPAKMSDAKWPADTFIRRLGTDLLYRLRLSDPSSWIS
jgi:diaminohydroxyphosphoribosylaminopyrimidine deaminase/5-amino-6-(5-phosphoribosylamino)uracil reductase